MHPKALSHGGEIRGWGKIKIRNTQIKKENLINQTTEKI